MIPPLICLSLLKGTLKYWATVYKLCSLEDKTSDTKKSSFVVNSLYQKYSFELDQTKSCINKVRKQGDPLSSSKTNFLSNETAE